MLACAWVCRGRHATCEGPKSKVHSLPASHGTHQSQATRLSKGSCDLLNPVAHPSLSDFYLLSILVKRLLEQTAEETFEAGNVIFLYKKILFINRSPEFKKNPTNHLIYRLFIYLFYICERSVCMYVYHMYA